MPKLSRLIVFLTTATVFAAGASAVSAKEAAKAAPAAETASGWRAGVDSCRALKVVYAKDFGTSAAIVGEATGATKGEIDAAVANQVELTGITLKFLDELVQMADKQAALNGAPSEPKGQVLDALLEMGAFCQGVNQELPRINKELKAFVAKNKADIKGEGLGEKIVGAINLLAAAKPKDFPMHAKLAEQAKAK